MERRTQSVHSDKHEGHKWNTADTITSARMMLSLFLAILPLKSPGFLIVYTLTGLTDVLDGWIARKTGTVSEFGARLDSIADLLFYGTMLVRLFPVLRQTLPAEIWYAVAGILVVRLASYGTAAIKYHRFASLHTWLNKLTGAAVFLLPYFIVTPAGVGYSWVVCVLAAAASLEELAIHLCRPGYDANRKSLFQNRNADDHVG